jgi:sulfiredoxin
VRNDDSAEAAWVHAHLHRIEGDLANASYWYGKAGRKASGDDLEPNATALPLSYFEARFSTWIGERRVLKSKVFPIEKIYVPTKRRQTLDVEKVRKIAESMLQKGQDTPIMVREDGERLVLVEGLHRLEACRSLGEQTVLGYLVQARKHWRAALLASRCPPAYDVTP